MFVLTKFFANENYRSDFINGKLYLSSVSAYTRTYAERPLIALAKQGNTEAAEILAKQQNDEQRDIYEGTVACFQKDQMECLPDEIKTNILSEVRARAVGYNYCNLMCFCKMNYEKQNKLVPFGNHANFVIWHQHDMKAFGDYAVIIKSQNKLLNRINAAIQKEGYHYLCGPVHYHSMYNDGRKVLGGNMIHFESAQEFDIIDILSSHTCKKYDAFDKGDKYKSQNEWRIVVDKGIKKDEPLIINVGSLEDIVDVAKRDELVEHMEHLFMNGQIGASQEGYYGNIKRNDLRNEFYRRGDGKAVFLFIIGGKLVYE